MRFLSFSFTLFTVAAVLVGSGFATSACSPKDGDPPRNGVNDVRKACELRASWTKGADRTCINCVAAAPSPACDCPDFKEFGGLCKSQDNDRRAEPSCTDAIGNCTRACAAKDCACVESCYAQAEACKRVAAAEDGCIADACTKYCQ